MSVRTATTNKHMISLGYAMSPWSNDVGHGAISICNTRPVGTSFPNCDSAPAIESVLGLYALDLLTVPLTRVKVCIAPCKQHNATFNMQGMPHLVQQWNTERSSGGKRWTMLVAISWKLRLVFRATYSRTRHVRICFVITHPDQAWIYSLSFDWGHHHLERTPSTGSISVPERATYLKQAQEIRQKSHVIN
jgi:hypothetical protein